MFSQSSSKTNKSESKETEVKEVKEVNEQKHVVQTTAVSCYPDHVFFKAGLLKSVFRERIIQYHFVNEVEAKKCVTWLQSHKQLAKHDLKKLMVKKEKCGCVYDSKNCYIVRLTESQFDALCEKGAYENCRSMNTPFSTLIGSMRESREEDVLKAIEKIKPNYYYNMAYLLQTKESTNVFYVLSRCESSRIDVITRIKKIDDILFRRLLLEKRFGSMYTFFEDSIFQAIIKKLDNDTLKRLFIPVIGNDCVSSKSISMMIDHMGMDTFKECLALAGDDAFKILLKLSEDTLMSLFKNTNDEMCCKWMPNHQQYLNTMARQFSADLFLVLISKIDKIIRSCALSDSYIKQVAESQPPEVFLEFIQKCGGRIWNIEGCSSMIRCVLKYQSSKRLLAFFKIFTSEQVYDALSMSRNDNPILSLIMSKRDVELFALILSMVNSTGKKLQINDTSNRSYNFHLIQTIVFSQPKENVLLFFQILDEMGWQNIERLFYEYIHCQDVRYCYDALILKAGDEIKKHHNLQLLTRYQHNVPINSMPGVPLADHEAVETLLNKYVLQDCTSLVLEYACPEKPVFDLFRKRDMLVKVVRYEEKSDKHNEEFCASLKDVKKRQVLRQIHFWDWRNFKFVPSVPKEKCESKHQRTVVVYEKGEIIRCRSSEERVLHKNNKKYSRTKATSVTLMSQHGYTQLFGHHDKKRELVGYAFDINKVKLKAMFSEDCGTFRRLWVGKNLKDVMAYANEIEAILFNDLEKFKQRIDEQPDKVNEVLAKLTQESVTAIVIGRDTSAARELALVRQAAYFEKFNRILPIGFFNSTLRQVNVCASATLDEARQQLRR